MYVLCKRVLTVKTKLISHRIVRSYLRTVKATFQYQILAYISLCFRRSSIDRSLWISFTICLPNHACPDAYMGEFFSSLSYLHLVLSDHFFPYLYLTSESVAVEGPFVHNKSVEKIAKAMQWNFSPCLQQNAPFVWRKVIFKCKSWKSHMTITLLPTRWELLRRLILR